MNEVLKAISDKLPQGWEVLPAERNPYTPSILNLVVTNGEVRVDTTYSVERIRDLTGGLVFTDTINLISEIVTDKINEYEALQAQ